LWHGRSGGGHGQLQRVTVGRGPAAVRHCDADIDTAPTTRSVHCGGAGRAAVNSFLLNSVLALTWCAASGAVTALNFAIGFILGYGILSVQTEITRSESYRKKLFHFLSFTLYF